MCCYRMLSDGQESLCCIYGKPIGNGASSQAGPSEQLCRCFSFCPGPGGVIITTDEVMPIHVCLFTSHGCVISAGRYVTIPLFSYCFLKTCHLYLSSQLHPLLKANSHFVSFYVAHVLYTPGVWNNVSIKALLRLKFCLTYRQLKELMPRPNKWLILPSVSMN